MKNAGKNCCNTNIFLDSNALYEFCYVSGLKDFGISCGKNTRVIREIFKKEMEQKLFEKTLYIPSTTIFEFTCNLRDNEKALTSMINFLKDVSKEYKYNIFEKNNYGILFSFDGWSEEIWSNIFKDYSNINNYIDWIVRAKVGAEADIMTIFSKSIIHAYILDYYYDNKELKNVLDSFNMFLLWNPSYDTAFKNIKFSTAWELYNYYLNSKEGKKVSKKEIFEYSIKLAVDYLKFYLDMFDFDQKLISKIDIEDTSELSIQSSIYKWFKKNKDEERLKKIIVYIVSNYERTGLNGYQLSYFAYALKNMFTNGKKREKNDAEDFWNLGFVCKDESYLVTFELELIDIIGKFNNNNLEYIKNFYNI